MFYLTPPRHISTLPNSAFLRGGRTSACAECRHCVREGSPLVKLRKFCLAAYVRGPLIADRGPGTSGGWASLPCL